MTGTMTYTGELVTLSCWCGTVHAVPAELASYQKRCHDTGGSVPDIYCPLGHAHVPAGRSKLDIERDRAAELERQLASAHEDTRAERVAHSATKAKLTKATRRTRAGVCPCCNRSFVQLARHMATKHPDYSTEDGDR
jgi:hypothetical protein